mmetsp:Transcript_34312/g.86105  ORF Transcript_34312/g.86105 Transcript_34312/m.86105 type:complete len:203 (+) Transcript_34312:724-1332(+)
MGQPTRPARPHRAIRRGCQTGGPPPRRLGMQQLQDSAGAHAGGLAGRGGKRVVIFCPTGDVRQRTRICMEARGMVRGGPTPGHRSTAGSGHGATTDRNAAPCWTQGSKARKVTDHPPGRGGLTAQPPHSPGGTASPWLHPAARPHWRRHTAPQQRGCRAVAWQHCQHRPGFLWGLPKVVVQGQWQVKWVPVLMLFVLLVQLV